MAITGTVDGIHMANLSSYFSEGQPEAFADLIDNKPVSTGTITRGSGTVAAQTVRLETLSGDRQIIGSGGVVHQIDAMVLGYKGHPTITDTDLRAGDRFTVSSVHYEVIAIMPAHTDNLQVYLKVRA